MKLLHLTVILNLLGFAIAAYFKLEGDPGQWYVVVLCIACIALVLSEWHDERSR